MTHPDRLVSKEELLDAVWPDVAVTEAVLRVTIGMVRKVLGDQAPAPRFITTMPRRGYRFLASVTEAPAAVPAAPVRPTPPPMPAAGPSEAPATPLDGLAVSPRPGVLPPGEAGIGKSRLVRVVHDHVAHEAHLCWECRGMPYYQHTALYPITECLQRWLQWRPGAAPAAARVQLEALLTQAQLALEEAVPLLADLMALPLPAERYSPRGLCQRHAR